MNITLSWDLFVIVFFAVVVAYSYIIGKHDSVKIIVATYIATVTVQGLGNIFTRLSGDSQPLLSTLGLGITADALAIVKLIVFIMVIIFIASRAGIEIAYNKEGGSVIDLLTTGIFGFATAGLILSTLLTFISGSAILDANLADTAAVAPFIQESKLMQLMIFNQDLWYALPALLLVGVGFLSSLDGEDDD